MSTKNNIVGVIRHDGSKSWIIPASNAKESMASLMQCVWRDEYLCDIAKKTSMKNKMPNHQQHYDCVDCLMKQSNIKDVQKLINKNFVRN